LQHNNKQTEGENTMKTASGKTTRLTLAALCFASMSLFNPVAHAQQNVPFAGGSPVAPTGLADIPLGDGPWHYKTGENMDITVELLARFEYGMALAFMPDESLLAVTRRGIIYQLKDGVLREIPGGPPSVFNGESGSPGTSHGYIDIALHPDFANNQWIYLVYTKPLPNSPRGAATLGRGRWTGSGLADFEDIFGGTGEISGVSRIAFGNDGKIYMTTTGGGDPQTLDNIGGKVLRLNDDGSAPTDNPFSSRPGARPEIYSYGHRGALGLAIHPANGSIWQSENGPNGGDEINLIEPGLNYGWPVASLGRTYQGPWQADGPNHAGYQPPVVYWMPSIAVSGLLFYDGDALPKWKGDIFVGALRTGEVNGTGHIQRILLNENFEELRRESLLTDLYKRMRDLKQGPDGYIYITIEERDGGILRIKPAN
jgi:aldose sugar dehydrogenase